MHEAWASLLDIALAFWLLQRQLGVASVAPGAIFFLCSLAALGVAASMGSRQREWLEAIQKRVKTTSDMLGSMKEVRMTGLQLRLKEELQQQRKEEITASRGFKNALTLIVTLSYITITLAPVIAFTMFSLIAKKNGHPPLDRGRAFTCLTLFALLSSPMALIIEAIGGVVTAIGSVQRIGLYLSMSEKSGRYASTDEDSAGQIPPGEEKSNTAVSHTNNMLPWGEMLGNLGPNMVVATGASAGWEKDKPFVIKDLSFNIRKGTTTFIIGPVGSGKSTLLRAIVGETTTSGGLLRVAFSQAAFCSQAPWITNDTIRNNILGTSLYDKSWYETVLQACALNTDVSHLPNGDQQMAGSKGVNLSGGQQARLALARAVYSRKEFVLLDDVMSGLDSRAEETLFQNLFGETGLFKALGLTVVFATNAVRRISYADHIIALTRDGTIEEQGTFDQLASASKQDQKVAAQNEESGDENAKTQIGRPAVEIPAPPPPDTTDRRTGDRTVYKYYIKSVGIWNAIIFTALCASFVFALIFPQYLVKWWTDDNALLGNEKTGYYLGGYAGLGLLGIASLTLSCWHLVVHMMPRASTEFHDALLDTTLNAQFTLFTEVDIGTTTNRFSQDLQLIDMELPLSLFNTTVGTGCP
jgi:ABC-type multidrug transport system fused ATPase/permease subunit